MIRFVLAIAAMLLSGMVSAEYHVVVASFANEVAAARAASADKNKAFTILAVRLESGEMSYRLVSGPFQTADSAAQERSRLISAGFPGSWIVGDAATVAAPIKPISSTSNESPPPVFARRSLPSDLDRGIVVGVTPESLSRALSVAGDRQGNILPEDDPGASGRISRLGEIELQEVRLRPGSLMSANIEEIFRPYLGKSITTQTLLDLRNQANQLFVTEGYINSGVVIPDQQVVDGVVMLETIEGQVSRVDVSGDLRPGYIRSRLDTRAPLNLKKLQTSLKLLEKDPLVQRINARILPGDQIGTANVDIEVHAAEFYRIGVRAANNRSPSIGAEYGELYFSADNLTGFGDTLFLSTAITEGLDQHAAEYQIPFNGYHHRIVASYSKSNSTVIEEPFNVIDIVSLTEAWKLGVILPVIRTPARELAVEVMMEARRNQTSLLGVPFSFSEGAVDGESRVAPVRVGMTYAAQGARQSLAGRLVISSGTTAYDATQQATGPDGDFTSVLAQFQYARQLGDQFSMSAKVLVQHALDPLLAIERVSIGGADTVRGYRENQLVRDNVILTTIEGRYRLPVEPRVQFIAFVDWGAGSNHKDEAMSQTDDLASVGIGVDVRSIYGFSASLYLAHGFKDVVVANEDLQDKGIHFRLGYEYRF